MIAYDEDDVGIAYAVYKEDCHGYKSGLSAVFSDIDDAKLHGNSVCYGYFQIERTMYVRYRGNFHMLSAPFDLDNQLKIADEKLREETLAGLTPDQKRVLGLS